MYRCCVRDRSDRLFRGWLRVLLVVAFVSAASACSSLRTEVQARIHLKLTESKWQHLTVHAPLGPGRLLVELINAGPGEIQYVALFDDGEIVSQGRLGLDYTQFSCKPLRRPLTIKFSATEASTVLALFYKGLLLEDISVQTVYVDQSGTRQWP